METPKTMTKIPTRQMFEKDEITMEEARKARVETTQDSRFVSPFNLVSCPKKNFDPCSTLTCSKCEFWMGFAKKNREKDLVQGNVWSACMHPMGRDIHFCGDPDEN